MCIYIHPILYSIHNMTLRSVAFVLPCKALRYMIHATFHYWTLRDVALLWHCTVNCILWQLLKLGQLEQTALWKKNPASLGVSSIILNQEHSITGEGNHGKSVHGQDWPGVSCVAWAGSESKPDLLSNRNISPNKVLDSPL